MWNGCGEGGARRRERKEGDVKGEGRRVRRRWKERGRRWKRKIMKKVKKERMRKNAQEVRQVREKTIGGR